MLTRRRIAPPSAAALAVIALAGCGGGSPDPADVLVELDSRPFGPTTAFVLREDGGWRARCDESEEASGTVSPERLARWRERVAAFGSPLVIHHRPARDDATVTTASVGTESLRDDARLEDLGFDLLGFARRRCAGASG